MRFSLANSCPQQRPNHRPKLCDSTTEIGVELIIKVKSEIGHRDPALRAGARPYTPFRSLPCARGGNATLLQDEPCRVETSRPGVACDPRSWITVIRVVTCSALSTSEGRSGGSAVGASRRHHASRWSVKKDRSRLSSRQCRLHSGLTPLCGLAGS